MRYLLILVLFFAASCDDVPTRPSSNNIPDSSYLNNVSFLLANSGKKTSDSSITLAPSISWKDSLGNYMSLEDFRGKVVILNFFATWCGPCNHEMPYFQHIADSLGYKVSVIAVSIDDGDSSYSTLTSLNRYADKRKISFQIISDPHQKAYSNFGAKDFIPWTFVIDRTGNVVHTERGMFDSAKVLTDIIDRIP